ncbi:hypothetical protein [Egbenema bharatensis]|uniref:hypothetical protein n=1 Tax=Egbenema bharatensis TaxID=3463334 RepID=UPI003A8A3EE5
MNDYNIEDFELYVSWTVSVLQTQNPYVIRDFRQEARLYLTRENLTNVLVSALHYLADADSETFQWALHNYEPNFYVEVRRRTALAAARLLIQQGFVPGQDFSSVPVGGLLVNLSARAALEQQYLSSTFSACLLREILHTFRPA